MISVFEAEQIILGYPLSLPPVRVALAEAGGRVLAESIRADRDLPPFDRVMMDGIAVAYDAWAAGCRHFRIETIHGAGRPAIALDAPSDGCIQVMTGAVLPNGTDTVIPCEQIRFSDGRADIAEETEAARGQFVHRQGSDRKRGDTLLAAGVLVRPPEMAVLASAGQASVAVSRLPSAAVISNGDELVDVGQPAADYQIRPSNAYALECGLRGAGLTRVARLHTRDDRASIEQTLAQALAEHDFLILSGGVSAGQFDYVPEVLAKAGVSRLFHKIAQKPGKPFWFGLSHEQVPVFALPGNPVSTLVCFHRYVLPWLWKSLGHNTAGPEYARLAGDVSADAGLTFFPPVRVRCEKDGVLTATPVRYAGSGDYASLADADGVVELPAGKGPFTAGFAARLIRWSQAP